MRGTRELIEVAEGRWLDVDLATAADLAGAQRVAAEVDRLRLDAAAMLATAARLGLSVPDELRERLSLGVRGLPATRRLHGELAAIVRPAL